MLEALKKTGHWVEQQAKSRALGRFASLPPHGDGTELEQKLFTHY